MLIEVAQKHPDNPRLGQIRQDAASEGRAAFIRLVERKAPLSLPFGNSIFGRIPAMN